MRRSKAIALAAVALASVALGLAACTTSQPYRTNLGGCPLDANTAQACADATPEIDKDNDFTLHYVEFDDQGWLHHERHGDAEKQLDELMKSLRDKAEKNPNLAVVVYVHGWKHNAGFDDENVMRFRRVLRGIKAVDQFTPPYEQARNGAPATLRLAQRSGQ